MPIEVLSSRGENGQRKILTIAVHVVYPSISTDKLAEKSLQRTILFNIVTGFECVRVKLLPQNHARHLANAFVSNSDRHFQPHRGNCCIPYNVPATPARGAAL